MNKIKQITWADRFTNFLDIRNSDFKKTNSNRQSSSSQNISVSIFVTGSSRTHAVIYNYTGTRTNVDLPVIANGTMTTTALNRENSFTLVNGSVNVLRQSQYEFSNPVKTHPYQSVALGLIGFSGLMLLLVAWYPKRTMRESAKRIERIEIKKGRE